MPYAEYDPLTTIRSLQAASSIRDASQERKLRAMQMLEMQRQYDEANKLRAAAQQSVVNVPQKTAPAFPANGATAGVYQAAGVQAPDVSLPAHTEFDQAGYLNRVRQIDPLKAQGYEAQQQEVAAKKQKAQLDMQKTFAEINAANATTREKAYSAMKAHTQQVGQAAAAILSAPDADKPKVYQDTRNWALQNGLIQPNEWPEQYTPEVLPRIQAIQNQAIDADKLIDNEREKAANNFKTVQLGSGPQGPGVYGPDATGAPTVFRGTLPKTVAPAVHVSLGGNNARNDKSYQFSSTQLDKVGQPVEQAVQRLGRLQDTIAQNSPQADALVGPELLTVMAGGQGSGLRMNEAEIARVVGGRSKWESLKADINQWSTDPSKANSITPAQRQQIRALVGEVNRKLIAKQQLLDDARNKLIDAQSPEEHRRIVAETRKALTALDMQAGGGGAVTVTDPNGGVHSFPDQKSADAFKQAAGIK